MSPGVVTEDRRLQVRIGLHAGESLEVDGRRRSLHRAVGRALVEMGSLGEAAPHFAQAAEVGDPEAVDVLRQAMHQAEERGAYREALTLLADLVELLPEDDHRWLDILDAMSATAGWVVEHRADAHALPGISALRAIETRALPEAGAHLDRARAAYPRPWMSYSGWCDWAEAALRRAQGDLAGWRDLLVPTAERLVAMEALPFAAAPLLDLAEGESVGGDAAAARRAADQLGRVAERLDRPLYSTLAALAGAWADLAAGHHRMAAEAAAQAAGVFAELGYGGFQRRAAALAAQAGAGAQP